MVMTWDVGNRWLWGTWDGMLGTGGYDMGCWEQVVMTWDGGTGGYDMGWGNRWL